MEKYNITKDIKVFCITATSFPNGVMAAHEALHAKVQSTENRKFFGISHPEKNGSIIYKAAVEELYDGEAEKLNCETFTIKKGEYISIFIPNFMAEVQQVGHAFQELLSYPNIDPNGYCLEMYTDEDVRCMIPLTVNSGK